MAVPLLAEEPRSNGAAPTTGRIGQWLRHAVVAPFAEFLGRLGGLAVVVIGFVVFYKFGEAMLGRMAGVFYVDLAFTKVDLVLLDWMMPQMSGIEVCRQLRRKPARSRL